MLQIIQDYTYIMILTNISWTIRPGVFVQVRRFMLVCIKMLSILVKAPFH